MFIYLNILFMGLLVARDLGVVVSGVMGLVGVDRTLCMRVVYGYVRRFGMLMEYGFNYDGVSLRFMVHRGSYRRRFHSSYVWERMFTRFLFDLRCGVYGDYYLRMLRMGYKGYACDYLGYRDYGLKKGLYKRGVGVLYINRYRINGKVKVKRRKVRGVSVK